MTEDLYSPEKLAPKVVWAEGMYIGPHHFQLQSRHHEDSIRFVMSALWFEPYGFAGLELDAEALQNDIISLLHARGIFPDGLCFDMPQTDALPQSRSVRNLIAPDQHSVTVLLAVPLRQPRGPNCLLENGYPQPARHIAEKRVVPDENTGADARSIQVARKSLRLLLDSESSEGFVTLPLARLRRDGSGHFQYDPAFVPPVLEIQASRLLMLLTSRLVEILDEKSAALARHSGAASELGTAEIPRFWLRHAVNSASAALRHLLSAKRKHPEELFVELSRLAGALCTFQLASDPSCLPVYKHMDLTGCFEALDRQVREYLEVTLPANCVSIPLKHAEGCFYEGEISDQRCLGRARWILGVHAHLGGADLMVKVPQLVKVCSPHFVRELVRRALPGLALQHLATPPAAVSANAEKQYFEISRIGPCWEHIVKTKSVGVYIPGDILSPETEILVVLERA